MSVDPKFNEDLMAEFLAINTALTGILQTLCQASGEPKAYLAAQLERGLLAIHKTNLWSIPDDRKEAVAINAEGRFSEIIASAKPPGFD